MKCNFMVTKLPDVSLSAMKAAKRLMRLNDELSEESEITVNFRPGKLKSGVNITIDGPDKDVSAFEEALKTAGIIA